MKLKNLVGASLLALMTLGTTAQAADYTIDNGGAHASVNFRIQHLGFSWLSGRFDTFSGTFSFDESAPEQSVINVEIDTTSVNSNHAERDKHLRSGDFLDVEAFPTATFSSTSMAIDGESAVINGALTLHGVTKDIVINADFIGSGDDPWGGYRAGFVGTTRISLADFNINFNLGPASEEVELTLYIEGIRN